MREEARYFIERVARCIDVPEPVVEIGAYQTPAQVGFADLRPLFAGKEYLGVDLIAGPGVDRIEDVRSMSFADGSVGAIVCVDALEHFADPFRATAEIHRVLKDGGVLLLVTPFAFPIHHRPDYTRFTPDGIRLLLARFGACGVYSQGDAQAPHSVYSIGLKGTPEKAAPLLDGVLSQVEGQWHSGGIHDALDRCEPLASIVRCDRPEQMLGGFREGFRLAQSFRCEADGLCRLEVKLRSHGEPSVATLRLSIDDEAGTELAAAESRFVHVGTDRWVAFSFAPLARSASRRLTIALRSTSDAARVEALASRENLLPGAELRIGGDRAPGTLCFEAYRRS